MYVPSIPAATPYCIAFGWMVTHKSFHEVDLESNVSSAQFYQDTPLAPQSFCVFSLNTARPKTS
jgi:hypothetical protein